jgi:hypothetical protein
VTPADPSTSLAQALRQLVARRGEEVVMTLFELFDEHCPVGKENVVFQQLRLASLCAGLRPLSQLAMKNLVEVVDMGEECIVHARINMKRHSAGEKVDLQCYIGPDWEVEVRHANEERGADEASKRSSKRSLPSRGVRD